MAKPEPRLKEMIDPGSTSEGCLADVGRQRYMSALFLNFLIETSSSNEAPIDRRQA